MRFLFSRKPRAFFDVDSGNGGWGGGAGAGDTNPNPNSNTDPNANPQNPNPADNNGGNTDPNKNNKKPTDPEAARRWAWQQNRERAEKLAKENAQLKAENAKNKPVFDADSDPDGSKERAWDIQQEANRIFETKMKELGLEDTLSKIQYEKEEAQFFEVVNTEAAKFKQYWIDAPTKEELKTVLTTIDEKGITPEQIILLTKAQQIIERLKPGGFAPGSWAKPQPTEQRTPAQIREALYAQHGAFGRG